MISSTPLVFAHIGDLHITKSKEQNYIDYLSIMAQLQTECAEQLDFVFLPGDISDNGLPEQYKLVATGLKMLSVPVHIIAGDHDMEQGSLENFYKFLPAAKLPMSFSIKGTKCIFLDVCGTGKGGPDFRLGTEQLEWLKNEMETNDQRMVLFMHTYPDDLVDSEEKALLNNLIAVNNVLLFDMGHTHYNEIANDGHTVFSATRSTGQIEEGPVGYSLITIDNNTVSWRFKPLADPFPFVMITSPSDRRLRRDEYCFRGNQLRVDAIVFGARTINEVYYDCGNTYYPLEFNESEKKWSIMTDMDGEGTMKICVEAFDETGRPGRHHIEYSIEQIFNRPRSKNGNDDDAIEGWPENGIFGTQLGPNRNGKTSV